MAETFQICSAYNCDFSTPDQEDHFCGKCGAELVMQCSDCENLINQPTNVFCTKCGKDLKKPINEGYDFGF